MLSEFHLVPWFCQEAVVFWTTLFGVRFAAMRSKRDGVGSDDGQHFGNESVLFAGSHTSRMDGGSKVTGRIKSPFEADAREFDAMEVRN